MNALHEISNKDFLKELSKRIKEGEIKFEGDRVMGKLKEGVVEGEIVYHVIFLKTNIGDMVNAVIERLKNSLQFSREERMKLEEELSRIKNGN